MCVCVCVCKYQVYYMYQPIFYGFPKFKYRGKEQYIFFYSEENQIVKIC